jgi:hypothetical protein
MYLVFERMPDDPLSGTRGKKLPLFFTQKCRSGEHLSQVGGSPAGKGIGDQVLGLLKPSDQFSSSAHRLLIFIPMD